MALYFCVVLITEYLLVEFTLRLFGVLARAFKVGLWVDTCGDFISQPNHTVRYSLVWIYLENVSSLIVLTTLALDLRLSLAPIP